MHVLVFGDHQARDGIADDARHEYHRVHDDHGHDNVQRIAFRHQETAAVGAHAHVLVLLATVTAVTIAIAVQRHHTPYVRQKLTKTQRWST